MNKNRIEKIMNNFDSDYIIDRFNECIDAYDDAPMDYYYLMDFLGCIDDVEKLLQMTSGVAIREGYYYNFDGYGYLNEIGDENDTAEFCLSYWDEFLEEMENELNEDEDDEDGDENKPLEKQTSHAFGKDVYFLGVGNDGEYKWLEKASWDCGWYWGFGYIETYTNHKSPALSKDISCHTHFDSIGENGCLYDRFNQYIENTPLTDKEIWTLCELIQTYYNLRNGAETLTRGGANLTESPIKELLTEQADQTKINEVILPKLFEEVYKILTPDKKEA